MTRHRAPLRLALAGLALAAPALALASPAAADDAAGGIAHVESSGGELRVLVDVPEGVDVKLGKVSASLDGTALDATAEPAGTATTVERTTILAIDTSDSMEGERFDAARDAATTFVETAPQDVAVGIVTFDGEVSTALAPTTDRDQALAVIDGLGLDKQTMLYDGVLASLDAAGDDGERSVLVLSDGADTGETPLDDVTTAIGDTGATVDVVALDQSGSALDALEDLAAAGGGSVIEADPEALAETFSAEADVLARQVLVTAPLPDGLDADQGTVAVTLPSKDGDVSASALVALDPTDAPTMSSSNPVTAPEAWSGPRWMMWAGVGAVAVGLFLVIAMLVPGKERPLTADERVVAYTDATRRMKQPEAPGGHRADAAAAFPTAIGAMSGVLERNQGLEDKIARTLTAAGSALKPSEWLLVHVAIFVTSGFVGYFIGGGSVLLGLLALVLGGALPRAYLVLRASRRRKAFQKLLPDTLQLMSGSLAAGLSLMQSVDTIVREGQEPVRSEFKRVLVETRLGVSLEDALEGVAERFDSQDWGWVVMAIRIQRSVGGNLSELLETVGATIREREYLRRQVAALSAEGKLSAYILTALPPGILVFILLTNNEFMRPMVTTFLGICMLVGAAVWLSLGALWMTRMVKVEV